MHNVLMVSGYNNVCNSGENNLPQIFLCSSMNMDCGVFGGWPYLAYQYVKKVVRDTLVD